VIFVCVYELYVFSSYECFIFVWFSGVNKLNHKFWSKNHKKNRREWQLKQLWLCSSVEIRVRILGSSFLLHHLLLFLFLHFIHLHTNHSAPLFHALHYSMSIVTHVLHLRAHMNSGLLEFMSYWFWLRFHVSLGCLKC